MNRLIARAGLIAAGLFSINAPAPLPFAGVPSDAPERVVLTARDVDASNQKIGGAYGALVGMWTKEFRNVGQQFDAPEIRAYRGSVRTRACGVIPASNALYCERANTIYFDDVFVAAQAKVAGAALGSDGDMAGIGIIAHEMGHAVAMQLGYHPRDSYAAESAADCLAGAFARQSQKDGLLEKGDVEEAFYGMASAGDPDFQPTGNPRRDARIAAVLTRAAHGTRDQRVANFKAGLDGGAKSCLPQLRS